jgi:UDP-N-acetylmuramate-alanine ligase
MRHPSAHFLADLGAVADHLIENLRPGDVLIVLSAGDGDQISAQVLAHLSEHEVNNG